MPDGGGHPTERRIGSCRHCGSSNIRIRRRRHRYHLWRCRSCNRIFNTPIVRLARCDEADARPLVAEDDIRRLEQRTRSGGSRRWRGGRRRWRPRNKRRSSAIAAVLIILAIAAVGGLWLLDGFGGADAGAAPQPTMSDTPGPVNEMTAPKPSPTIVPPTPTPAPTPQRADGSRSTPATGATLNVAVIETRILFFTNEERKQAGRPPLLPDAAISVIARRHSENLGRQNNMSHDLDGKDPTERAMDAGYDCRAYQPDGSYAYGLSENIARQPQVTRSSRTGHGPWQPSATLDDEQIAKTLVQGWMNSPGHRRNILDPDARRIGVGVAITPDEHHGLPWGQVWAAQNFSQCD